MVFLDDLGLIELLVGMVAVLFCYVGLISWWYIRTNNAKQLRSLLKASAVPIGGLGAVILMLAMWIEMTWPFWLVIPTGTNVLAGYNIYFGDVLVIMGLMSIVYAVTAYVGHHLHVAGVMAIVAGAGVAFYAWTGYTGSKPFTEDPWDTFLLYGAFALAAFSAFPATVLVDYYLAAVDRAASIWQTSSPLRAPILRAFGTRATGAIVGAGVPDDSNSEKGALHFRVPYAWQVVMLAFPVLWALAAVAALWYFGVTLPGHLGGGAGAAP